MGRVVCGLWAAVLSQLAFAWPVFLWLMLGMAWGPPAAVVAEVATVAAVWTVGGWAMTGRWPAVGHVGPLVCAVAATLLDAALFVFSRGPVEHFVDGAPFGVTDVVDIALAVSGVLCTFVGLYKLLPPRPEPAAQPAASPRP
jgi:hypothetical protein